MGPLVVKPGLVIPDEELEERFIHASGPGGQNVNKVASAVQLRFDASRSASLTEPVKAALMRLAGKRLTGEGILVITARRHREQERNRAEARARLAELIGRAASPPKPRRPTKVPKLSRRLRLEAKKRRGNVKAGRSRPAMD
jgi:ribosome-associated protein